MPTSAKDAAKRLNSLRLEDAARRRMGSMQTGETKRKVNRMRSVADPDDFPEFGDNSKLFPKIPARAKQKLAKASSVEEINEILKTIFGKLHVPGMRK